MHLSSAECIIDGSDTDPVSLLQERRFVCLPTLPPPACRRNPTLARCQEPGHDRSMAQSNSPAKAESITPGMHVVIEVYLAMHLLRNNFPFWMVNQVHFGATRMPSCC